MHPFWSMAWRSVFRTSTVARGGTLFSMLCHCAFVEFEDLKSAWFRWSVLVVASPLANGLWRPSVNLASAFHSLRSSGCICQPYLRERLCLHPACRHSRDTFPIGGVVIVIVVILVTFGVDGNLNSIAMGVVVVVFDETVTLDDVFRCWFFSRRSGSHFHFLVDAVVVALSVLHVYKFVVVVAVSVLAFRKPPYSTVNSNISRAFWQCIHWSEVSTRSKVTMRTGLTQSVAQRLFD